MSSRWLAGLACLLAVAAVRTGAAVAADEAQVAAAEKALEDDLIAPCCWRQTLAVHDSPIADSVRSEIHRRLTAGEASDAIRADLVKRYGDRIKAHPDGFPVGWFALGVFVLAAVAGGVPLAMAVRSRRTRQERSPEAAPDAAAASPAPASPGDGAPSSGEGARPSAERQRRLEERLQAELDEMDA